MNVINFKKSLKRWLLLFKRILIYSEGKNKTLRFKIREEYEFCEFDLIPLGEVKSENGFNFDILSAYYFVNDVGEMMRFEAKRIL
jgi:hypothetical protein